MKQPEAVIVSFMKCRSGEFFGGGFEAGGNVCLELVFCRGGVRLESVY